MNPQDEIDTQAEEWFNQFIPKLIYKQDYTICLGHSKRDENALHISRPYTRLFSTGITKIYRMAVLKEKLADVEYTEEELKNLDSEFEKAEIAHAKSKGDGWE